MDPKTRSVFLDLIKPQLEDKTYVPISETSRPNTARPTTASSTRAKSNFFEKLFLNSQEQCRADGNHVSEVDDIRREEKFDTKDDEYAELEESINGLMNLMKYSRDITILNPSFENLLNKYDANNNYVTNILRNGNGMTCFETIVGCMKLLVTCFADRLVMRGLGVLRAVWKMEELEAEQKCLLAEMVVKALEGLEGVAKMEVLVFLEICFEDAIFMNQFLNSHTFNPLLNIISNPRNTPDLIKTTLDILQKPLSTTPLQRDNFLETPGSIHALISVTTTYPDMISSCLTVLSIIGDSSIVAKELITDRGLDRIGALLDTMDLEAIKATIMLLNTLITGPLRKRNMSERSSELVSSFMEKLHTKLSIRTRATSNSVLNTGVPLTRPGTAQSIRKDTLVPILQHKICLLTTQLEEVLEYLRENPDVEEVPKVIPAKVVDVSGSATVTVAESVVPSSGAVVTIPVAVMEEVEEEEEEFEEENEPVAETNEEEEEEEEEELAKPVERYDSGVTLVREQSKTEVPIAHENVVAPVESKRSRAVMFAPVADCDDEEEEKIVESVDGNAENDVQEEEELSIRDEEEEEEHDEETQKLLDAIATQMIAAEQDLVVPEEDSNPAVNEETDDWIRGTAINTATSTTKRRPMTAIVQKTRAQSASQPGPVKKRPSTAAVTKKRDVKELEMNWGRTRRLKKPEPRVKEMTIRILQRALNTTEPKFLLSACTNLGTLAKEGGEAYRAIMMECGVIPFFYSTLVCSFNLLVVSEVVSLINLFADDTTGCHALYNQGMLKQLYTIVSNDTHGISRMASECCEKILRHVGARAEMDVRVFVKRDPWRMVMDRVRRDRAQEESWEFGNSIAESAHC